MKLVDEAPVPNLRYRVAVLSLYMITPRRFELAARSDVSDVDEHTFVSVAVEAITSFTDRAD